MRIFLLLLFACAGWSASVGVVELGTGYNPNGGTPGGAAGGSLAGTYPNPTLSAVGTAGTYGQVTTTAEGRVSAGTVITDVSHGGTGLDGSATGGANQFVRQNSAAGAFTVSAIAAADVPSSLNATTFANITDSGLTSGRIPWATTGGLLNDTAGFTFNGTTFTVPNITNSSLTATRVPFAGTAGLMSDDAGLTYTAASDLLVINHNANALPAPSDATTLLQIGGIDGAQSRMMMDGFGGSPTYTGRRANGTFGAYTAVVNTNVLVQMAGLGYGGTTYSPDTAANGSISIQAAENWNETTRGTKIVMAVTPTGGSVTQATILSLNSASMTLAPVDAATTTQPAVLTINHSTTGTAANGFGSIIQVQGFDDGSTTRVMSQINTNWTTAASGTRTSRMQFNVVNSTTTATVLALNGSGSASFAAGYPLTVSDTTASTTTAGALLIGTGTAATSVTFGGGNGNVGGTLTVAGVLTGTTSIASGTSINAGTIFRSTGSVTTNAPTGVAGWWRSGGTIGTVGGMVFQTDLGQAAGDFTFRAGATTPATVFTISSLGDLTSVASQTCHVTAVTSAAGTTVIAATDYYVVVTGSTTQTLTLPACATGRVLMLKNRSSGNVTVNRAGSDTIDGGTSATLTSNQSAILVGNTTDWGIN